MAGSCPALAIPPVTGSNFRKGDVMNVQQRIVDCLFKGASWRQIKISQYPDDRRNVQAEDMLTRLGREVGALEPTDPGVLAVDQASGSAGVLWREFIQEKIRSIGFRWFPRNAAVFMADLARDIRRDVREVPVEGPNDNPFL